MKTLSLLKLEIFEEMKIELGEDKAKKILEAFEKI